MKRFLKTLFKILLAFASLDILAGGIWTLFDPIAAFMILLFRGRAGVLDASHLMRTS